MSPIRTTTPATARRHEALYLRLAALTKQTAATAAHRPAAAVPEGVRILAEGLLFDIRPFATVRPRRDLPVAADYGGLATQLGQALVTLDIFEARHTLWNGALKCFVWRVDAAQPLPVERLRPQTATQPKSREKSAMDDMRRKVASRIQAKWDEAQGQGKSDAARDASALGSQTYPRAQSPG